MAVTAFFCQIEEISQVSRHGLRFCHSASRHALDSGQRFDKRFIFTMIDKISGE